MAPGSTRRRFCQSTPDLFNDDYTASIKRFDDHKIRAATPSGKMAKMVSTSLKECGQSREEIVEKMSAYLGKPLPKNMLDAWSSEDHIINMVNFIALLHATGDRRLLQVIAEMFGIM